MQIDKSKVHPPSMGGVYTLYVKSGLFGDSYIELGRSQWGPFWTEMVWKAEELYGKENVSYNFELIEAN